MPPSEGLPSAYRLDEGEDRMPRVKWRPRCLFIEVTNRCNLSCTTCPRTYVSREEPRDLSLDEFRSLASQFPDLERAVLHGIGEPLLNSALPEMIRYLKEREVSVLFNSNGTVLTRAQQMALAESGLDELHISLDAANSETYARIRGKDLFHRVVSNLKQFVDTKRRLGVETPRVSIWCMGMRENIDQLPELIRLAAEIGVPEVYVQRLTFFIEPDSNCGLANAGEALFGQLRDREGAIISECERMSQEMGIAFRASGAVDPVDSLSAARGRDDHPWTACRRPWTTAYVTATGNALPCCIAPFATTDYESLILGNVWEKGFDEIWNDEPYRVWRESLLGSEPPPACSGCGVWWSL